MSEIDNTNSGGWSNTPAGKSQKNIFTSIDYLSFRFNYSYEERRDLFLTLLELLNPFHMETTLVKGRNGYLEGINITPGITLFYGGDLTMTRDGQFTSFLEMKGLGCREYENNLLSTKKVKSFSEAWISLFDALIEIGGKCTRIDLPVDDCEGIMPISIIKEKIKNKEFTTRMKKIEEMTSYEDNDDNKIGLPDVISTFDSKQKGYSATIGNRTHIQLCIYDKNAEQANKGRGISFKHWVRFESRFYHENADDMFYKFYYALAKKNEHQFIIGCLSKIIQFKEYNRYETINRSRNPVDPNWKKLIECGLNVEMFKSPSLGDEIDDNASWFIRSASKVFLKIIAVLNRKGIKTDEIITAIVHKSISKVSNSDLASINSFLRKNKIQEFQSLQELKNFITFNNYYVDEIHEETLSLLIKKKTPKQIRDSLNNDGQETNNT